MEASRFRGDGPSLEEIRADLENDELTMTQRRQAFDDLRRILEREPEDREARDLLARYESEFVSLPDEPVGERTTTERGPQAVGDAQEQVGGDPFGKRPSGG